MSKVITTRFEHVCYDDAQGNLAPSNNLPPTYPRALDAYSSSSSASTAQSYASYTISGSASMPLSTPVGATITFVAPSTNTTLVSVTQVNVTTSPGSFPTYVVWPVGPGQIVTLPGALNSGTLTVQACTASNYQPLTTAFTLQLAWSL